MVEAPVQWHTLTTTKSGHAPNYIYEINIYFLVLNHGRRTLWSALEF